MQWVLASLSSTGVGNNPQWSLDVTRARICCYLGSGTLSLWHFKGRTLPSRDGFDFVQMPWMMSCLFLAGTLLPRYRVLHHSSSTEHLGHSMCCVSTVQIPLFLLCLHRDYSSKPSAAQKLKFRFNHPGQQYTWVPLTVKKRCWRNHLGCHLLTQWGRCASRMSSKENDSCR